MFRKFIVTVKANVAAAKAGYEVSRDVTAREIENGASKLDAIRTGWYFGQRAGEKAGRAVAESYGYTAV